MTGPRMLALLLLVAPVALPLVAAIGVRPETVAMLLPVGFLLAGVAATLAVFTQSALIPWVIALTVIVNAVAIAGLVRRRRRDRPLIVFEPERWVWAPAAAAAAAAVYALTELRRPDIGWDTRSIWFLHARLVDGGGHTYVAAMHNGAYSFSHVEYPLLVPGAVADAWRVAGSRDYRLGQVLIAALSASLLVVAGSLLGRVARGRWRTLVGVAVAVMIVLAAFGAAGRYASDGYADLPAAAAALAGAVALLVLPRASYVTVVGLLAVWIAGFTKTEGVIAAVAIAALVALRHLVDDTSSPTSARRWTGAAGWGALVAGPPLVWQAFVAVEGTAPTYYGGIAPDHLSAAARAHAALTSLWQHTWLIGWLALLIVVACVVLARARRRWGIGSPLWLGLLIVLYLMGLVLGYATGPYAVHWWLGGSADRVTILPRLLLLTELAVAVSVALAGPPPGAAPARADGRRERRAGKRPLNSFAENVKMRTYRSDL